MKTYKVYTLFSDVWDENGDCALTELEGGTFNDVESAMKFAEDHSNGRIRKWFTGLELTRNEWDSNSFGTYPHYASYRIIEYSC